MHFWMLATTFLISQFGWSVVTAQTKQDQTALADRLAIQETIALYAHRWDAKDASGFADLMTENAVFERWVLGERKSRLEGRQAILAYARKSYSERLADRQTRHHMSNVVLTELTAETAQTESTVLITHQTADDPAPRISGSGTYRITWRKTDRGWKIAERVLLSDRAP